MRITKNSIEIDNRSIHWSEVEGLRQTGQALLFSLSDGQCVVLKGVHRTVADSAFRFFSESKSNN